MKGGGGAKFSPNCLKNFPSFEPMPITLSNNLWRRKRHFSTVYFLWSQALSYAICSVNLSDQERRGGGRANSFWTNITAFNNYTNMNKRNSVAFLSRLRERGGGQISLPSQSPIFLRIILSAIWRKKGPFSSVKSPLKSFRINFFQRYFFHRPKKRDELALNSAFSQFERIFNAFSNSYESKKEENISPWEHFLQQIQIIK